jgi:hypothetical protein
VLVASAVCARGSCWKVWRTKRERREKACGLISSPCRRGSGGGHEFLPIDDIRPFSPLIALARSRLIVSLIPRRRGYCFTVRGDAGYAPHYH